MSAIFDAYNLPVDRLGEFYQRINKVITYPDGMTTSLGIVYWGREKHLAEIERVIPVLLENNLSRFNDVLQATRTPRRSMLLSGQTGITKEILRILKHDIELWLPKSVPLGQINWFTTNSDIMQALSGDGLNDQLAVISAGRTASQREELSSQTHLEAVTTDETVKLCDYYRTGKNLQHIRAHIYYDMGMDTWQKWAKQTSEVIIAMFTEYIQAKHLAEERLVPWPKEVRNGIEWAKMHLEIYAIEW